MALSCVLQHWNAVNQNTNKKERMQTWKRKEEQTNVTQN